jgi:hypothetical protein
MSSGFGRPEKPLEMADPRLLDILRVLDEHAEARPVRR